MSFRPTFISALLLALACSCVRPASSEAFVLSQDAEGGVYSYLLDLSDSLSVFDISFYTAEKCPGLELDVLWTGPSEESFAETVFLDGASLRYPYRTGVSMNSPGEWRLDVRVPGAPEKFRGLGLVCERYGTR